MSNDDFVGMGIHASTLDKTDFEPAESPRNFGPCWRTYRADGTSAVGSLHICANGRLWSVTIRDITLADDMLLEFDQPGHLSVAWYESISGEEFTPYRKLRAKSVCGFYTGDDGWRGLVHEGVPIRSVAVEVSPEFAASFLADAYPGRFSTPARAFASIGREDDYPELRDALRALWPTPRSAEHDLAYYEECVRHVLDLVVRRSLSAPPAEPRTVTADDRARIFGISSYIDDHYTHILKVPDLARIARMSPTKFKECFKAVTGCTLTQYIQRRRISQAEQMLHQPSFSIEQISRAVGYTCVSRFSELFRRETGLLPSEYRRGL